MLLPMVMRREWIPARWRLFLAALVAALAAASAAATSASAAVRRDAVVTSFDGTKIHLHFFSAVGLHRGQRAATVLQGPGWGGTAVADPNAPTSPPFGFVGVGPLRHAGYNVLTWDPRGFGRSGGAAEIDSAKFEARDVSALITWLAHQPEALLDKPGDPRVGMVGGSYGGGIQLTAAAIDKRIDAITPDISWNSLITSLDKNDTVKSGWAQLLYLGALNAHQRNDPLIAKGYTEGQAGFTLTSDVTNFFATRGPGSLVSRIHIPTLLLQGTVDTLFTLQEAVDNYTLLRANHVPTKMLWFCGGHGLCITNPGDQGRIQRDVLAWLGRYLKRDARVKTGPGFEWLDQNGRSYSSPGYPPPTEAPLTITTATTPGTLPLIATGGSGPYAGPFPKSAGSFATAFGPAVATRASNAVNIPIRPQAKMLIFGAPKLTLTYAGTSLRTAGRVLAQIVDDATGKVLGNQITPIDVVLDGARHTVTVPLEMIVAAAKPGASFTLQLVAQSSLYDTFPVGGSVTFSSVTLSLPTVR
jgi:ABC-2 type transport system ATP-binding protein